MKLGEIFKITSGGTPEKKKIEYYENGTIPWIKTGDLKGRYVSEEVECITELGLENSSAKILSKGTVLLAMYGATIGACSILDYEASTNQACAAFLPDDKVLPEYLYYYLASKKEDFIKDGVGGAQPNISAGYLKNVDFDLISIGEQEAIVLCLGKVETIIEKRKQQLQKLDELVKARFVEMFGDVKTNDKKWCKGILSEHFVVRGGKRIPKGMGYSDSITSHPYLRTTDMKNSTIIDDDIHYIDEDVFQKIKRYTVNAGDIYLTNVGVNLGMAGTIPKRYDGANLTENAVKLIPQDNKFNGDFLAFYLNSSGIQDYINERKMTVGVPKLAIFRIETIPLVIPTLELQNQFAAFVQQIDKSKLEVQKSLDKLQTLKKALMQKYFG